MRNFYFASAFFLSIIIIIIAFENINSMITKSSFFFVSMDQASIFFVVLGIAFLGFGAGFFFTLFMLQPGKTEKDPDAL